MAAPSISRRDGLGLDPALLRHVGNRGIVELLQGASTDGGISNAAEAVQRRFNQTAAGIQESHFGGVKSQYDTPSNLIELHIEAGANVEGKMMQDFLMALWDARDTLTAGEQRNPPVPGRLFMRPGGSKVLKMTMELLGEALGTGVSLTAARAAKDVRKRADVPMGAGLDNPEDVLDSSIVPEHIGYRDSLVGVAGVEMAPAGGGTSGATVDMLEGAGPNAAAAANERALYDAAVLGLRPFITLAVRVALPQVSTLIGVLEGRAKFWDLMLLKAKYKLT